jgi:hypothetical protein
MNDRHSGEDLPSGSPTIARELRSRLTLLVLGCMMTVALVFGLTFYFALIASESALTRQVPELGGVAAQLKGLLIMNTLVFVAIIIASLYALSRLFADRAFRPLSLVHKELLAIAEGALPVSREPGDGSFAALERAMRDAVTALRHRERQEIDELDRIAEAVAEQASPYVAQRLEELVGRKKTMIGETRPKGKAREAEEREERVFIQEL